MGAVELGLEDVVALDAACWALRQCAQDMANRGLQLSSRELYEQADRVGSLTQRAQEGTP